jgi:hypothetical protein
VRLTRREGFVAFCVAVLTILVTLAGVHLTRHTESSDAPYEKARQEYQLRLNHDPHRMQDVMVSLNKGRVTVTLEKGDVTRADCIRTCATATAVAGGYALALPVGFTDRYHDDKVDKTSAKVVKLTYWDPYLHRARTISENFGVTLPDALKERSIESMKPGESGFISVNDVITTDGLSVVYTFDQFFPERPRPLYGSDKTVVSVSRARNGQLKACLDKSAPFPNFRQTVKTGPRIEQIYNRC